MKKSPVQFLVAVGLAAGCLSGCTGGQQSHEYMESGDTTAVQLPDTAFYGHLGEGTGMSCLQLVTDGGDTLVLNKADEKTGGYGIILGEIANYTDRFAITTTDDCRNVRVAVNVSQLMGGWQSVADSKRGIRLAPDGKAKALSAGQYKYNRWSLYNCMLVLLEEEQGAHEAETRSDTLEVLKLSPDTLVLQKGDAGVPEKFYRVE